MGSSGGTAGEQHCHDNLAPQQFYSPAVKIKKQGQERILPLL
jgi:hypothetical protein